MKKLEIQPGTKFGDLTIESEVPGLRKREFICRCRCGSKKRVRLDHLRGGHTTSCGRCGLEYGGERRTLVEWAEAAGLNESTLRARLKVMSLGEAIRRGR